MQARGAYAQVMEGVVVRHTPMVQEEHARVDDTVVHHAQHLEVIVQHVPDKHSSMWRGAARSSMAATSHSGVTPENLRTGSAEGYECVRWRGVLCDVVNDLDTLVHVDKHIEHPSSARADGGCDKREGVAAVQLLHGLLVEDVQAHCAPWAGVGHHAAPHGRETQTVQDHLVPLGTRAVTPWPSGDINDISPHDHLLMGLCSQPQPAEPPAPEVCHISKLHPEDTWGISNPKTLDPEGNPHLFPSILDISGKSLALITDPTAHCGVS
ncbi:hypothetical protein JB92DRAFT_3154712 [Gautieria morchelliformis]|nr:hypothetical protein JB92DRAFT_3154712 [Gautieria morchelliformis]